MGLFWDLLQQSQISDQHKRAETLEMRVQFLREELRETQKTLHELIQLLEQKFGEDIDGNGRVG